MLANGGWDLTLIPLTWTIWRAPTNASKWRMGFNSAFKGLIYCVRDRKMLPSNETQEDVLLCVTWCSGIQAAGRECKQGNWGDTDV